MADYSEKYNLNIEVNDEKAKAELAQIDALAKKLEKDKATIKVAVSDSKAKEDLTSILALAQKLDNMRVDIRVAVSGDKQVIAQLSAIQKIQKQSSKERIAQAQIAQKAEAQANDLAERRANNEAKQLQTAINQAQNLADKRANAEAKLAQNQPKIDEQVGKLQLQQEGQMLRNAQSLINLQNKLASQGNVFTTMGKGLSQISTQLGSISNVANTASTALMGVAKPLLMIGGVGAGALGVGIASQVKGAIQYGMEVEQAQNLLKAQGISAEKVASTYKDIRKFSGITPFGIKDMTESVAAINSYVGDIDTATKATKVFGTSLFATGKDASSLYSVGVNLGQLYSGAFGKTDFKEVLRNVPTAGQALRDAIGSSNWEDFNKALGDNPNTKEIERTGNALEFLMDAMDKYNKKTNALEQANESLVNKWANTQEAFKNSRQDALMASGAYTQFGKLLDTLGDKMADPAVQKALTDLFKGTIPIMQRAQKAINDFDITKFVNNTKRGFDIVKQTVDNLMNNPIIKFGKDQLTKWLGLEGGAENIGADLGKILSKGIELGIGSIGFKGLALGTRGIGGLASFGGSIATMLGKSIATSGAKKQISNIVGDVMSTEINQGLQMGADKAMSRVAKNGAVKKSLSSKIGGALSKIGGGLFGLGVGMTATGVGTFTMSRSIRDVSDTIKKITDDIPTDLADINALNSKITNFVKWAKELGEINLGGEFEGAIAGMASGLALLGGVVGTVNLPAGLAMQGGAIVAEGVQVLHSFNQKLKTENLKNLADLPKTIADIPDLSNVDMGKKLGSITTAVESLSVALGVRKTANGPEVKFTSNLKYLIDGINQAIPPDLTDSLATTFENLQRFADSITSIGNIEAIADKAIAGIKHVSQAIEKLTNSELFKPKGTVLQTGKHIMGPIDPKSAGIAKPDFSTYENTLATQLKQFQAQLKPFTDGTVKLDVITEAMNKINELFTKINSIPDLGKPEAIETKMTSISTVMDGIKKAFEPLSGKDGKAPELIDTRWMDNMIQSVNKLIPIINTMNSLPDPTAITPKIDMVRSVMEKIQMAFRPVAVAGGGSTELIDTRWMDNMIASTNKLIPMINTMSSLPDPASITPKVTMIRQVMIQIQQAFAVQGGGDLVDTRWMDNMIASVGKLIPVMQQLASMPDPATIIPKIDAVQMVLQRLKALSAGNGGSEFVAPNFAPMISQLGQLNTQIQQVASQKGSVDALANSFPPIARNADTATSSVNRLKSAIDALPSSKTITINLNDNASSTLREIVALLGSVVDKTVTVTTNKVTKEKSAVGGIIGNPAKFAEGGLVSRMFKNASRSFKQGQDTVHALLSQGEAVIRRSAVARVGTSFIDNLNHGNLQGAYQDLSSRVATNYNKSVANNQTYNNSPQIIQHFHGSSNQGNQFLKQQLKGI